MKRLVVFVIAAFMGGVAAQAVDFDTRACVSPYSEIFVSGLQRFVRAKNSDSIADKVKAKPTTFALGYQYTNEQWAVGLSASYEMGRRKGYDYDYEGTGDDGYMRLRDRTLGFTLFAKYDLGCGAYAKTSGFVGFNRTSVRSGYLGADDITRRGSHNKTRYGASVEFGKKFDFYSGFRFTPHVGFDYSHMPVESRRFYLAGAAAEGSSGHQNFYEIPVGVTFAKDFETCDWVITPSVDLTFIPSVGHMRRDNMNVRTGFASRTGSEWKVYGIGGDHWGGRVTAGIRAMKKERFDVDINYAYEGRKKYSDHRIAATIGVGF